MENKKVLITGGAGFIGSNLADALIDKGFKVVIVDSLISGKKEYVNKEAKFYQVDILSDKLNEVFEFEKPDYVYHLAAQIEVPKSMKDPKNDAKINLEGGFNVLENCRLHGVKKIIFSSTGGAIYGESELIPTKETAATYPLSFYGIHKLAFEKYLKCYNNSYNLDYSILRFSNVYGPRQFKGGEAGVVAIFIDNALNNKTSVQYGDGKQSRDFVYVKDVVRALILCIENNCQREINISNGKEYSLLDIRESLKIVLEKDIAIEEQKAKPGEQRRSCLDNSLALEILNWQPEFSLEEGIKETIKWAKSQKK